MAGTWLHRGVRIARIEWRRHVREFGGVWTDRYARLVVLLAVGVVLGSLAHAVGRDLAAGRAASPDGLWLVVTVGFASVVLYSSTVVRARFERLNPDLHLTTGPARSPAFGLLCVTAARIAAVLAVPAICAAVGLAVGLRTPLVALTVILSVASLTALAVGVGTAGRLAVWLVGTRLARGRFYRDLLVVFGWVPILAAWFAVRGSTGSLTPLVVVLDSQPVAWFVDLALLGAGTGAGESTRALGALGVVALAVPLLAGVTTALVRRIWERDPSESAAARGSTSLVGAGWSNRLLGGYVSRPVLTVARSRWLRERRVPRGLLSLGYVLLFVGAVVFPAFGIVGAPGLLLLTFALGLAAGFAFGTDPVGVEYRGLPMLLTAISGRQFVRGILVAALGTGVPLVTVVVLPLGVVSPASLLETIGVVCFGIAICACTVSVSLAVGMGVERSRLVPVPFFFTDVPVYAEIGSTAFRRMGRIFGIVTLAGLPAFLGNTAVVYEGVATVGIPVLVVRLSALLGSVLVAGWVSRAASRSAIRRFRTYRLR